MVYPRHLEVYELLLPVGRHVNVDSEHTAAPLISAVWASNTELARYLLKNGIDRKTHALNEETLLSPWRPRERISRIALFLTLHGADIDKSGAVIFLDRGRIC